VAKTMVPVAPDRRLTFSSVRSFLEVVRIFTGDVSGV